MERWTGEATARFVAGPALSGLVPTSTRLPSVVRLLLRHEDGPKTATTSCSGVLLGPTCVLTAAHCACGPSEETWLLCDARQCAAALQHLKIVMFFPTAGTFGAASPTVVHPGFRSPTDPIETGRTVTADLAVVEVERPVPLTHAVTGEANVAERQRTPPASYGRMAFASRAARAVYENGVMQASKQKELAVAPAEWGPGATAGTLCTTNSSLTRERRPGPRRVCRRPVGLNPAAAQLLPRAAT
jgi:hypothetical protein